MEKSVQFQFTELEAGQVMDALSIRAEAYERTAAYLKGKNKGEDFVIEEVKNADEATKIAKFYRRILVSMRSQMP